MKALKICIIVAWLIALALFIYSRISEGIPDDAFVPSNDLYIGHKTIEFPKEPKPLPTNLVMETDGQFYRIVNPTSPLGPWVIVGGGLQYSNKNDILRAYWDLNEFLETTKTKSWKPVESPSDVQTNQIINGSTNGLKFDTDEIFKLPAKHNEIDFGQSTVYVLNVHNLTPQFTNLFQLQIEDVPVVTLKPNGDVIYDTNNVSEATRIFWREMTYQARKVTEKIESHIPAKTEKGEAIINGKKNAIVGGSILHGKVTDEHGITYYLSSEGLWHSNRVVGDFYLNDKTQTWEEYK